MNHVDMVSIVSASLTDPGRVLTPLTAGLFVRVALIVEVAAPAVVPGVALRTRLAAAAILTLTCLPAALAGPAPSATAVPSGWPGTAALVAGETLVGAAFGFVVMALASALCWSGALLGGVSGLAWQGDDDGQEAGVEALARWLALGVFVGAGGLAAAVLAVVDGTRVLPVGAIVAGSATIPLVDLVVGASSSAIALAVAVALPGLAAILAFHVVAALVLRAGACAPGPGLVQAATALVLLAALYHGASGWGEAAGPRVRHAIDGLLPPAAGSTTGAVR